MSSVTQYDPPPNGSYHMPLQFEPFRYSPLPTPTSIRLLSFVDLRDCVRAVSFDGFPLLEINLEVVDLSDNTDYKCLSYTWGNWEQKYQGFYDGYDTGVKLPIIVNNQLLYVTRNLHEALWQFGPWGQWHVDGRFEPYNKTELIRAAEEGQSRAVQSLIERGANLHLQDKFGETALHYAAENGHLSVVEILLRYGADANTTDKAQRTPKGCCLQRKRGEWSKVADALTRHLESGQKTSTQSVAVYPLRTWIWADAICINQQDLRERASQVALMSRIYTSAESVLVWLGLPDKNTQSAWEFLTYLVSETNETRINCSILAGRHEKLGMACWYLFDRRWFWRRWVIQEMALARRLQVFCGAYEFDWQKISSIILGDHFKATIPPTLSTSTYLDSTRSLGDDHTGTTPYTLAYARLRTQSELHSAIKCSAHSHDYRNVAQLPALKLSLQVLLVLGWRFGTTNPRDRIYALLGVAEYFGNKSPVIPDYTKSIVDLYTEVGKLFVEAPGVHQVQNFGTGKAEDFEPLEGLSFVQGTSCKKHRFDPLHSQCACVLHRLPSWVPDFNGPLSTIRIHRKRFCASAGYTARFYPSNIDTIKLDACRIDCIVDAENDPIRKSPHQDEEVRLYEPLSWLEMTAKLDVTSATGQNRAEVLWRTLMVDDINGDAKVAKRDFKKLFCEDFASHKMSFWKRKKYMSLLEQLHNTDDSGSLPSTTELNQSRKTYDASTPGCVIKCSDLGSFRWKFAELVRKRGLLRTQKGLMGLGPRWVMPGDEIWLLAGARTPYILRKLSVSDEVECYRMIGEAYVHGIMYGELCKTEDLQFRPIEIH